MLKHYVISRDKSVAVLEDGSMKVFIWYDGAVSKVLSSGSNYEVPEGLEFPSEALPEDWDIELQFSTPYLSYTYHNIVITEEVPRLYKCYCRLTVDLDKETFTAIGIDDSSEIVYLETKDATFNLSIVNDKISIVSAKGDFTCYLDYLFKITKNY